MYKDATIDVADGIKSARDEKGLRRVIIRNQWKISSLKNIMRTVNGELFQTKSTIA